MSISKIYKSPLPSFNYHFKNGMTATFINGRYMTDNTELSDELDKEIGNVGHGRSNHPYIYIDANEKEIDSDALSPMELIKLQAKAEAREELLAEQEAARQRSMDPSQNISESVQSGFARSITTTDNVQEAISGNAAGVKTFNAAKLQASAFNIPGQPDPSAPTVTDEPKDVAVTGITAPTTEAAIENAPEGTATPVPAPGSSTMADKVAALKAKAQQ